ncbi:MAG: phytoene/squalene synthase family protein [Pseudomonadota bacterium]|nr:phytoene/squalene synthase family protein [Pseudomonadota bacterium]
MTAGPDSKDFWRLVREQDPDRYLSVLFAPKAARESLMALYAFGCELHRIPRVVSEPMLGEIRLQWWRDALTGADTTGSPVADRLREAMGRHGLPVPLLLGAIDARSFDLDDQPMPDETALKAYLTKTDGTLFALAAHILGGGPLKPDHAARAAGVAFGLSRLLRELPRDLEQGRYYLPGVAAGGATPVEAMRELARTSLTDARRALADTSSRLLPAFLPLANVESVLQASARLGDPASESVTVGPLRRQWNMWRAALRGRI